MTPAFAQPLPALVSPKRRIRPASPSCEIRSSRRCSNPPDFPSRRRFLHLAALSLSLPPSAAPADQMPTELPELAAKMPSSNMPDIYYPSYYLGQWRIQRDIYAADKLEGWGVVDAPGHMFLSERGLDVFRQEGVGRQQNFRLRYIAHRDHVIEDRVFNIQSELGPQVEKKRVNVVWDADKANVLTASWGTGGSGKCVREVKVTSREFVEPSKNFGIFVTSEYARVVDVVGEGALVGFGRPPSIYGRRRLMRYKVSSVDKHMEPNVLDRFVMEYIYPPTGASSKPAVVIKYRDFLTRTSTIRDFPRW